MVDECRGGRIADCRIIEVLADHRHCLSDDHASARIGDKGRRRNARARTRPDPLPDDLQIFEGEFAQNRASASCGPGCPKRKVWMRIGATAGIGKDCSGLPWPMEYGLT